MKLVSFKSLSVTFLLSIAFAGSAMAISMDKSKYEVCMDYCMKDNGFQYCNRADVCGNYP